MKTCKRCNGIEFLPCGKCAKCSRQFGKNYREKNPDKIKIFTKEWKEKNKEHIKQYNKEYREKNREIVLAQAREYRKSNAKKIREQEKIYRNNNAEKVKKWQSNWKKENAVKVAIDNQNRRAKKRKNGGELSKGLFDKLFHIQKGKCACCKIDLKQEKPHMDHIIPIAKGGMNVDRNIQLLCYKCNLSKKDRDPIEFMQSRGFLL